MKLQSTSHLSTLFILAAAILGTAMISPTPVQAKAGATDPIPGTSNSGVKSGGGSGGGGGGGNSNKPTSTTSTPVATPAPVQPIVTAVLNFTAAASVNNVIPVCTGSYRIDPYYPTLSLMTLTVNTSSMNVPDGTQLTVTINIAGGTGYPVTSNVITLTGGAGSCTLSEYVTPGTTITSVIVADLSGAVISAGN